MLNERVLHNETSTERYESIDPITGAQSVSIVERSVTQREVCYCFEYILSFYEHIQQWCLHKILSLIRSMNNYDIYCYLLSCHQSSNTISSIIHKHLHNNISIFADRTWKSIDINDTRVGICRRWIEFKRWRRSASIETALLVFAKLRFLYMFLSSYRKLGDYLAIPFHIYAHLDYSLRSPPPPVSVHLLLFATIG